MTLPDNEDHVIWKATISEPPVTLFVESASDGECQISLIDHQTDMWYSFLPLEKNLPTARMRGMLVLTEAIKDFEDQRGI